MTTTTNNGLGYSAWMTTVDEWCYRIAGLSVHDLPDCCFADWHTDGMKPAAAARKAIRAAKDEF